ncbi:MAG TPA: preprotein translocase subunit YajC [Limnochordia bacterium]
MVEAAAATGTAAGGSLLELLLPFVVMFLVFYFLLIRPQQQQQRKRKKMLGELKRGDRVVTVGGLHGEITALRDDVLTLRIADKVEVKISRSGVSHVLGKENASGG